MLRFTIRCVLAVLGLALTATDTEAQRLLALEGIELRGTVRIVEYGAGVCNVDEEREPAGLYEERRANHGQPLDIWQVDVAVYNGSGRWLDHVAARYQVEAAWPPCTNWSEPPAGRYPALEWAGAAGHIQESGRNVVPPGETLSVTHFIIVFHEDDPPRFENWTLQYELGELPAAPGDAAGNAGRTSAFRGAGTTDSATRHALHRPQTTASRPDLGAEGTCAGKSEGTACWMELANHPQCYLWNPNLQSGATATWTAECRNGFAQGTGTIQWTYDAGEQSWRGLLEDGKKEGDWVEEFDDGTIHMGPYVAGEREGDWVVRFADGRVTEGLYVDSHMRGNWVIRFPDGGVHVGPYVQYESSWFQEGQWVSRFANGDSMEGRMVAGERVGTWAYRFRDGTRCQVWYENGVTTGNSC